MAFRETWSALMSGLNPGMMIPNWTAHRGSIGEPFEIGSVDWSGIVVSAPGAKKPLVVARRDFEVVYDRWDDYIAGRLQRNALTPLTWYSKYVISILHWLERSTGRLP